jgi:hypothetical protein
MEGRFSNGVLVALTNCKDPAREVEFNKWYSETHLPDITSTGLFKDAARFENVEHKPGEAKYLAFYETDAEDLAEARTSLTTLIGGLREAGRSSDLTEMVGGGIHRRIGSESSAAKGKPVTGLLLVSTDCKDAAKEDEFNRWYNEVHIPDILGLGLFHSAYRFENPNPGEVLGKYLAVYETDKDPSEAAAANSVARDGWEKAGRFSPLLDIKTRLVFKRL